MAEYIEREAALEVAIGCREQLLPKYGENDEYVKCLETVAEHLYFLPAADVRPVKHGKWLKRDDMPWIVECKCSVCGYADYPSKSDRYWFERNYCPNCGADMREVDDED